MKPGENALLKLLPVVSGLLTERTGLRFPPERWDELAGALMSAAREHGLRDAEDFAGRIVADPARARAIEDLAQRLTVNETYFFREPETFAAFEGKILGVLQAERTGKDGKRLKIWSAGCSTGEEPYSIAIALWRCVPDLKDWQVTLLASDLNVSSLEAARAAHYGEWSFRQAPDWLGKTYFQRLGNGRYALRAEIRGMVEFFRLNLVADAYPNPVQLTDDVDVIFCRNVLMYFSAAAAARVVDGFCRALRPGGYLIVAPAEASMRIFSEFETVNLDGVTLFRKPSAARAVKRSA